jgi:hypothetical protein
MFIGHYAPAFVVRKFDDVIPLWLLFLAVQFVDVLWSVFVMLGIEKAQIVPGITATNPLDLYYMPYTHSLVAAIGWAVVVAVGMRFLSRFRSSRQSPLIDAMVLSHWFLDLLVHRPDLPLYDNTAKVGWDYGTTRSRRSCSTPGCWLAECGFTSAPPAHSRPAGGTA